MIFANRSCTSIINKGDSNPVAPAGDGKPKKQERRSLPGFNFGATVTKKTPSRSVGFVFSNVPTRPAFTRTHSAPTTSGFTFGSSSAAPFTDDGSTDSSSTSSLVYEECLQSPFSPTDLGFGFGGSGKPCVGGFGSSGFGSVVSFGPPTNPPVDNHRFGPQSFVGFDSTNKNRHCLEGTATTTTTTTTTTTKRPTSGTNTKLISVVHTTEEEGVGDPTPAAPTNGMSSIQKTRTHPHLRSNKPVEKREKNLALAIPPKVVVYTNEKRPALSSPLGSPGNYSPYHPHVPSRENFGIVVLGLLSLAASWLPLHHGLTLIAIMALVGGRLAVKYDCWAFHGKSNKEGAGRVVESKDNRKAMNVLHKVAVECYQSVLCFLVGTISIIKVGFLSTKLAMILLKQVGGFLLMMWKKYQGPQLH